MVNTIFGDLPEEEEEEEETNGLDEGRVEDEEEEDIPLSDIGSVHSDADIVPHQKLYKNDEPALLRSLSKMQLPWGEMSFVEHQTITAPQLNDFDVTEDLHRELAFYKQASDAAKAARDLLEKAGEQFTRPVDYFAEMVKSEEHMGKIQDRMVKDLAAGRASEKAKRQRMLKKIGKSVEKSKAEDKRLEKKEMHGKIKSIREKQKNNPNAKDDFDVEIEAAVVGSGNRGKRNKARDSGRSDRAGGRNKSGGKGSGGTFDFDKSSNFDRSQRNAKYGGRVSKGGSSHHKKNGSSRGGAGGGGGGGGKRPGKNKRTQLR